MNTTSTRRATQATCSATPQTSVLFVCLGNICRSPSAEGVFRAVVDKSGLASSILVDSCGTGGGSPDWYLPGGFSYHEGDDADSRMSASASKRGYKLTSISRPLKPEDVRKFDYIVGMEEKNLTAIRRAVTSWREDPGRNGELPDDEAVERKLKIMTDFCTRTTPPPSKVPDPYYGGAAGFELVLDLLEDACDGLLDDMNQ